MEYILRNAVSLDQHSIKRNVIIQTTIVTTRYLLKHLNLDICNQVGHSNIYGCLLTYTGQLNHHSQNKSDTRNNIMVNCNNTNEK